jgi:hypothetical protein
MISISDRLASLGAKYRGATRTAKDGQEYSQLIFEAEKVEISDAEVCSIFSNPNAYHAIKQLYAALKGVKAIELDEKIEGAQFYVRLGAVSAANGPEYTFNDCVIDKLRLERLESEALLCSFRVTTKPALDGKFGELISRMGHTVVLRLNAQSPSAQAALPLTNGTGPGDDDEDEDDEGTPATLADALKADAECRHGVSMDADCAACLLEQQAGPIGTPEQEREKARLREKGIAQQLSEGRGQDADAAIGDGKTTAELLATKGAKKKNKAAAARHATH